MFVLKEFYELADHDLLMWGMMIVVLILYYLFLPGWLIYEKYRVTSGGRKCLKL